MTKKLTGSQIVVRITDSERKVLEAYRKYNFLDSTSAAIRHLINTKGKIVPTLGERPTDIHPLPVPRG